MASMVRGSADSVVRDLAALNKREMLAWDIWGIMREWGRDRRITEAVSTRLDAVAALIAPSLSDWDLVRETCEGDEAIRTLA